MHVCENILKDKYFGKIQLGTLEISKYIPGFLYCVDGIVEKYIRAFLM
jgi:hypothetical protein